MLRLNSQQQTNKEKQAGVGSIAKLWNRSVSTKRKQFPGEPNLQAKTSKILCDKPPLLFRDKRFQFNSEVDLCQDIGAKTEDNKTIKFDVSTYNYSHNLLSDTTQGSFRQNVQLGQEGEEDIM